MKKRKRKSYRYEYPRPTKGSRLKALLRNHGKGRAKVTLPKMEKPKNDPRRDG
jgi:hypothetical protein